MNALEQINIASNQSEQLKMQIELELKYPLNLRRFIGEERVAIVDAIGIPIAQAVNYNHAYELVRLANCCYALMNDLSQKRPDGPQPRNLGLSTSEKETS
jgi:hypothetical protein